MLKKIKGSGGKKSSQQSPSGGPVRSVCFGRNYFYPVQEDEDDEAPPWDSTSNAPLSTTCSAQSTVVVLKSGAVHQRGTLHGQVCRNWTKVEIPLPGRCIQVSAGRHYCIALMDRSAVVTWGAGHFGQLGVVQGETTSTIPFSATPLLVERLLPNYTGSPVTQVAAGDWHALAVTEAGQVWSWGSNRSLQCGFKNPSVNASNDPTSNNNGTIALPLPLHTNLLPVPMEQIAAGRSHSVALTKQGGQVYCWGSSAHGQCGVATRRGVAGVLPTAILESGLEMAHIAAGGQHTLALSKAGRVFSWGNGREGQLGLSLSSAASTVAAQHPEQTSKPRLIHDLDFVAVAAGQEWKLQQQQQSSSVTSAEDALSQVPNICSIHAAASYSAAVSSSGHLYCWGSNDVGQLGLEAPWAAAATAIATAAEPRPIGAMPRDLHIHTFDSNHNVLLPVRVEVTDHMHVRQLALGPTHMWCFGTERPKSGSEPIVGRTLYEVQDEQRRKRMLSRSRKKAKEEEDMDEDGDEPDSKLQSAAGVPLRIGSPPLTTAMDETALPLAETEDPTPLLPTTELPTTELPMDDKQTDEAEATPIESVQPSLEEIKASATTIASTADDAVAPTGDGNSGASSESVTAAAGNTTSTVPDDMSAAIESPDEDAKQTTAATDSSRKNRPSIIKRLSRKLLRRKKSQDDGRSSSFGRSGRSNGKTRGDS